MKLIIVYLLLKLNASFCMQTFTGLSRQKFGAEFLDNLNRENRVRLGIGKARQPYSDVFEDMFDVYDPSFLAQVWPKLRSGVHLNVGNSCWDDFGALFRDLLQGRAWASSAVDASGRYSSGTLDGNHLWLGSKHECFDLEKRFLLTSGNDSIHELRNGDYLNNMQFQGLEEDWRYLMEEDELMQRMAQVDQLPPFRLSYTIAKLQLNVSMPTLIKSYAITLGLCMPRSCTSEDISHVLDFSIMINDHLKPNKTSSRSVKVSTIKRIEASYEIKNDAGAIILIVFTVMLVVLVIVATVVDLKLINFRSVRAKSMSFDLERPPMDNRLTVEALKAKNRNDSDKSYRDTDLLSLPRTHCCWNKDQRSKQNNVNVVDMETLTINNINNSNEVNHVKVNKIMKSDAKPSSTTLDVVGVEETKLGGCKRCGKYKKQCAKAKESDNFAACPRISKYNTYEAVSIKTEQNECKRNTLLKSLLLCFSLNHSLRRIFNTNMANRDLYAIHVLKVLTTFWMIYVHVCLITSYVSANGGGINNGDDSVYNVFSIGTYAFDTLFFISGVLSAHHFFYLKSQYTTKELVSFGGAFGQVLQCVCFITNRAIRMIPSYMYVMFVGAYVARRQRWTSALELPENDSVTCDKYWWRNLLYINTFYDNEERCMQWSWYLSAETQLHAAGVTWAAAAAVARWRLALLAGSGLLAAAVTADVVRAVRHHTDRLTNSYAMYDAIIERAWSRPAPYFVGLFTGWVIHKLDGQMKMGKVRSSFLWGSCVMVLTSSLLRPWTALAPGATAELVMSSLAHSFWALALSWPVVVFATQSADWSRRVFSRSSVAALSRLSYGVILLHGVVARSLVLAADTPLAYHTSTLMAYSACTAVLSTLGALVLSVMVETPCCSLLRRLTDCAGK